MGKIKNLKQKLSILLVFLLLFSMVPNFGGGISAAETLKSPVINADGTVTYHYQGNGTETKVIVKGAFNTWQPVDMTKDSNNVWSIALPSKPGISEYGIASWSPSTTDSTNGDWQGDPLNPVKLNGDTGNPLVVINPLINPDNSVTIHFVGNGTETKVIVKGGFNNWTPVDLTKSTTNNIWSVKLDVAPGTYEYGIVAWSASTTDAVNGDWKGDPANPTHKEAGNFSSNAILEVPQVGPVQVIADRLQDQPGGKTKWYVAGDFQGWNNANPETQLKHLVDGFYEYSTVLDAGTYEFKFVKNGSWDGFSNNGNNFSFTLTEKTKVNFYVNEALNQAKINLPNVAGLSQYTPALGPDKWPRLVGDIQAIFAEANWNPGEAKQFFVDYNFDGTLYKLQRSVPIGKYEAKVTFGPNWDENYGSNGQNGGNLSLAVLDPADVVFTINYAGDKRLAHNYIPAEGKFDGLINRTAIKFDSRSMTFKKPFGAIKEQSEDLTLRIATAKGDAQVVRVELINGAGVAKSFDMRKATTIGEEDYFEVTIPKTELTGIGIWGYKFILVDGATKVEYGDDGLSGGVGAATDDGAVPFNLTIYARDYKTPDWMKGAIVYQIFPDRFFDGNKENNRAKTVDGYRGYLLDNKIVPNSLQYFDGGVPNDPTPEKVWGKWSDVPENPRQSTPELKPYYPDAKTDGVWTNEFYGGDIQGIEQKIDYLKSIGVTVLYLNPVAWAASNHKYDATDYKHLDPMFGESVYNTPGDPKSGLNYEQTRAASDRVYIQFAKAAKEKNIKIIADGVFNHVGDDSIYFDRYEKYPEIGAYEYWKRVWDKVNNGESQAQAEEAVRAFYTSKLNPLTGKNYAYPADFEFTTWFTVNNQKDKDGVYKYDAWWGYDSLPAMDAKTPQPGDTLAIAGEHEWNNVSYRDNVIGYDLNKRSTAEADQQIQFATSQRWIWMGARGWRLDVAPDVSTDTWKQFRTAVKSTVGKSDANRNVIDDPLILGEEWGVATHYLLGDQFDSVMNYQFRNAIQNYMITGNASQFNDALEVIRENYPKEAWEVMLNLVDSHDTIRNLTKLDNPTWEEENTKIAPDASDKALKLQALTAIFQMGYPGAPTIYYGDEVGVTGTKDPDSRRTFPWERVAENNGAYSGTGRYGDLFNTYQKASSVRNEYQSLFAAGDINTAYSSGQVIAYARKSDTKGGLVVINNGTEPATIEANVAGFLPNGITLEDKLEGKITATVDNGKISMTVPALTGLMMVSQENLVTVPVVQNFVGIATKGQVALSWDAVEGAQGYHVYRTGLEGQALVTVGTPAETSFVDKSVVNGTRYYYFVTAVKVGGESSLSQAITALPSFDIESVGTPNKVKDVTLGVGNKTEEILVAISIPGLTDDPNNAGKEAPNLIARLLYYQAATDKANAADTKLRYKEDTTDGKKIYYASFEPTESGSYNYFAKVSTNEGDTFVSSTEESMTATRDTSDGTAPNAPVLSEIVVESNRAELNWSFEGTDAAGFEIYRKIGNSAYQKVAILEKDARKYTDFTASNDTNYTYKVAVYDQAYNRSYSEEKAVTPKLVMVDVTLSLHIPDYTPKTDDIYIAGDFNGWNASGGKLTVPSGATTRDVVEYSFKMMAGKNIQYKYTRGQWSTEAFTSHTRTVNDTTDSGNWAYSSTDTNMRLTISNQGGNKMAVEDTVLRWVDMPMILSMPRISYGEDFEYLTTEDHFTLKGKVPYGVAYTINDRPISEFSLNGMNQFGDVYVENIPLQLGLNTIKLHIEPTQETLNQAWYTDKGRASQATKTITAKITRTAVNPTPTESTVPSTIPGPVDGVWVISPSQQQIVRATASQLIPKAQGGAVRTQDGTSVVLPKNAVNTDTDLTIGVAIGRIGNVPQETSVTMFDPVLTQREFTASVTQFQAPVTVTLPYKGVNLQGIKPSQLAVFWWNPQRSQWVKVGGVVDTVTQTVSVPVFHFSTYAVMADLSQRPERLSGDDRYGTAIAVAEQGWASGADAVVLVNATTSADALAGTPLAFKLNAPILLTDNTVLTPSTAAEIKKLGATTVVILGGTAVVSKSVEDQLIGLGYKVIRYGGTDRYDTARLIAGALGISEQAIITSGVDAHLVDALAISSWAAHHGVPILFSESEALPVATMDALKRLNVTSSYVVGGSSVISDDILKQVNGTRLAGADRYETAATVANDLSLNPTQVYVATGLDNIDALVAGNLAAKTNSPLLFVGREVPASTLNYIHANRQAIGDITIIGGLAVVQFEYANTLKAILTQ